MTTHGLSRTLTYNTWARMRTRCAHKEHKQYKDYGGRGIKVCARWSRYENFLSDMGEQPKGLTLERKNNNQGYSKSNCVWDTPKAQARNRRSNKLITHNGETMCMSAWAERLGISRETLFRRLNVLKQPLERALTDGDQRCRT
jgi:hypothetical protein